MKALSSKEIRHKYLEFFKSKAHTILPSAPLIIKDDPTLLFTNAGMNPFKDIFLGVKEPEHPRIADSQKCLRVSGKHNDLEEVGHDTYHHTLFEMLGNWSFGDYFKEEAINWAWEFLTQEMGIDPNQMYATVFGGDETENLERDHEAAAFWAKFLPESRILNGSKKDNFWEMGDTGPCGPCSEIHIDLRSEEDRQIKSGHELVNNDHPQVIEIWNLVFMEFNRKANGQLERLPAKHVDTGMGFERLCMVIQGKTSSYDTDVFSSYIAQLEIISGFKYGENNKRDIAMRVISDHIRATAFSIADGQLPSNSGAGYVIRRILRRAIRYGYTYLELDKPFIFELSATMAQEMGEAYPELLRNLSIIQDVIKEEEKGFLRTLAQGIQRIENGLVHGQTPFLDGKAVFELYDTYGFPVDLTALILREKGGAIDESGFASEMEIQKNRSRNASELKTSDWVIFEDGLADEFIGYDFTESYGKLLKFREVKVGKATKYQMVFRPTPFYPEGGGQVGDRGFIVDENGYTIEILDTRKETGMILHISNKEPKIGGQYKLNVVAENRKQTAVHHTATHLLHEALREVLGKHVEQKGSLVNAESLRFDFSHFTKMESQQIEEVEAIVNERIRKNFLLEEFRDIPIAEAQKMGAMALFGEKYGNSVRAIKFGSSIELCGGTHLKSTGEMGFFVITSETAVAAGVRRIEAIAGTAAWQYLKNQRNKLHELSETLKHPQDLVKAVFQLKDNLDKAENNFQILQNSLIEQKALEFETIFIKGKVDYIFTKIDWDVSSIKNLVFRFRQRPNTLICVVGVFEHKPHITLLLSEDLVEKNKWDAAKIIREWAKHIQGGGGGQAFLATAGGKSTESIANAVQSIESWLKSNT